MSKVLHQYVVTETGERWCVFDCTGTLPHIRGEGTVADIVALRDLAQEFETLIDPARDDHNFIYEWDPPKWFGHGKDLPIGDEEKAQYEGSIIEIRNLLHRAADRLRDK